MRILLIMVVFFIGCSENREGGVKARRADKKSSPSGNIKELDLEPLDTKVVMEEKRVLGDKLTILIPKNFQIMHEEMLKLKYPAERRPTLVYTNESGSVNIALNHTNNRMAETNLSRFHKNMEDAFKNIYPSANGFRSGVFKLAGRECFFIDLRTPALDTPIRNVIFATSCEGRMLLVSFNVTEKNENEWLAVGNKAIMSVRVSE